MSTIESEELSVFASITIEDKDTLTFYRHVTETGKDSAVVQISKTFEYGSLESSAIEIEIPLDRIKEFIEGLKDMKRSANLVKRLMGGVS